MKSPAGLIRHAIEHEGYGAITLAPAFLARVLPHLSGNLDTCSDDLLDPQEAEDAQDHLTGRQAVLLQATPVAHPREVHNRRGRQRQDLACPGKARLLCRQGNRAGGYPTADLVPIHVDENLRNTRKIAEPFKSFAGKHFTPRGGTGLPVRRVQCLTEDALSAADDCIEALMDEGWANNQIALLTTNSRHPAHLEHVDAGTIAEYRLDFHANSGVFYGHVLGFKGLERAAEQLYVGLSGARSLLVVVGGTGLLEEAGGRELKMALAKAQA